MSDNGDAETKTTGTVSTFYPDEDRDNTPPAFMLDGKRYSVMDDEDAELINENVTIRFRYRKNGRFRNVVKGSVEVLGVQQPTSGSIRSSEGVQKNELLFSLKDAWVGAQSSIRSATLYHKDREDSTVDDLEETAEQLANLQIKLAARLREARTTGEA